MDKDHALEDMMGKLGDFGRYQCFQFILHILAAMTAGMHMLSLVTVAAVPDHRCWIDGVDTSFLTEDWNSSLLVLNIPKTSSGSLDSCLMYNAENETVACSKWVYDTTYRTSSRAIEWDLVCKRRWMGAIIQSIFMLGIFFGCVTLGRLADKIGRKLVFCWSAVFQIFFGIGVAFTPEIWSFLTFRFFYGAFGCAGCYLTGFVLTIETIGPSKRTFCGIAFPATFSIGTILVAVWGAIINNNRQILQVVYGLHGFLLIPHMWLMDESPRWLWSQGRIREAVNIVEKGLKFNKSSQLINKEIIISSEKVTTKYKNENAPSVHLRNLFKVPTLRKRILILCFCFFSNSLVYYGLALSSGMLAGNPYVVMGVMGFVDLFSLAFVSYLLTIWGRRAVISSFMLCGGTACLIAPFIPLKVASTGVAIVGKLFIAGSFATVYNYGAELLPTVVRNSAIGMCATSARLSSAITPFISILGSYDPKIPAVIFGIFALISGYFCLYLPETLKRVLPQTIEDGENFGVGDTCFQFCHVKHKNKSLESADEIECIVPLNG